MPVKEHPAKPLRITPEGKHFFFGYYDRKGLSADNRYHLGLNPAFRDRPNTGADTAPLGVIDLEKNNTWTVLEEFPAWNWQMGACAQWTGPDPSRSFVCNVRDGSRVFGRVRHVRDGIVRDLDKPLYDVSDDGTIGISVNFGRVHVCRQGYGYPDIDDPWAEKKHPDDDGLWTVDIKTGKSRLIVSLDQVSKVPSPENAIKHPGHGKGGLPENMHWINHIMISPSGSRVLFLHRWIENGKWGNTRLLCCGADGSGLTLVNPGPGVSHCDWLDDEHILAWCQWYSQEWHYYLMNISENKEPEILGRDLFSTDGHCSFNPGADRRWMLTDTYPDKEEKRGLILFDRDTDTRYDLGRFSSPRSEQQPGDIRCDLHPRWSADGNRITFDAIHEGFRGIYMMDISGLVLGK